MDQVLLEPSLEEAKLTWLARKQLVQKGFGVRNGGFHEYSQLRLESSVSHAMQLFDKIKAEHQKRVLKASGDSLQQARDSRPASPLVDLKQSPNLKLRISSLRKKLSLTNYSPGLISCELEVPNGTEISQLGGWILDQKKG